MNEALRAESEDRATDSSRGSADPRLDAVSLEEIEQLITDAASETSPSASVRADGPQQFDFRRPNKFSREHVRALELVNESYARQLGTLLSTTLRAVSQVTVASVSQQSYDDYITSSPNPTLLTIISLEPLSGAGILQVPLPLAMSILDRLLGGIGTGPYPSRPLTDIEEGLLNEVLVRCIDELTSAFESIVALEPVIVQLESNPQFAQVAAPSDMVVVVVFDTRIGGQEGQLSLCLPFASLQPALERIGHRLAGDRQRKDEDRAAVAMEQAMQDVPVDISVRFATVTLTSEEVGGLQVGDVLPLDHPTDRPLSLLAGGVALAPAVAGRKGKRLACRIVDSDLQGEP